MPAGVPDPAELSPIWDAGAERRDLERKRSDPGAMIWVRMPGKLGESRVLHTCALAYLSDINAMEAMGDSGILEIRTSTAPAPTAASTPYRPAGADRRDPRAFFDRYAVVHVRDTGPGIAEDHREKLFYPFFTTKKQGSGVGLSMARKIVDSHHGLIDVESRPGAGAIFIVRLPMTGVAEEGSAT